MPDGIQEISRTGKISRSELRELAEPSLHREPIRPKEEDTEVPKTSASITGIMPIYREPADETAERDDDMPAE